MSSKATYVPGNLELERWVFDNISSVEKPDFFPKVDPDRGTEGSTGYFSGQVEAVFPELLDYLGLDPQFPRPRVFVPDSRESYSEFLSIIAREPIIGSIEAAEIEAKGALVPGVFPIESGPPVIWAGYFRPYGELFYREAALEETAHYLQATILPEAAVPEKSAFVEGIASGIVSEIGQLIPRYSEVAERERARQIQSICWVFDSVERGNREPLGEYVLGRAYFALSTAGMDSSEKQAFLRKAVLGQAQTA